MKRNECSVFETWSAWRPSDINPTSPGSQDNTRHWGFGRYINSEQGAWALGTEKEDAREKMNDLVNSAFSDSDSDRQQMASQLLQPRGGFVLSPAAEGLTF